RRATPRAERLRSSRRPSRATPVRARLSPVRRGDAQMASGPRGSRAGSGAELRADSLETPEREAGGTRAAPGVLPVVLLAGTRRPGRDAARLAMPPLRAS